MLLVVSFSFKLNAPNAVFCVPVVLVNIAFEPTAVFKLSALLRLILFVKAKYPTPVLWLDWPLFFKAS